MADKPRRIVYMVCVPPPRITDSIEEWIKQQGRYWRYAKLKDEHAQREVRYAASVIQWKLGGEQGPPPERPGIGPCPPAPRMV